MGKPVKEVRAARHTQWLEKLKRLIDELERHAERMKKDDTWSSNAKVAIESENERLGTIHSDLREIYET